MYQRRDRNEESEIQSFAPWKSLKTKITKGPKMGLLARDIKAKTDIFAKKILKSSYMKSVLSLWQELKTKIVGSLAMILTVVLICALSNCFSVGLGYEVIVDGENIGLVTDRSMVYTAVSDVRNDLSEYFGEEYDYQKEPVFVRRVVSKKKLATTEELKDALLSNIDAMVEAYAVMVDGEVLFGVSSEDAAEWVFSKYKQKYIGEEIADDMIVDFCEKTEVSKRFVHIGLLETPESALEILSGNTKELATYTVKDNDTLWDIAEKYDTTVEHLLALNETIGETIKKGMEIRVEEAVPRLSVRSIQTVSLTESLPYEVEKIKDDSIYEGRTVVSREGKEGSAQILAKVTKVNGAEVDRLVLESETLSEPVSRIEKIGTKKRPATTGSGVFISPSYGTLSSRYGGRWGRKHEGIDVAGSYNSPIKAADGGIVTYSGWMSGYGNYIVINHENGYETAYGHCASLSVKTGDRVAKGDVIAKMGNTGRSTGTHLHFEVKKNGQHVDPLKYISY